jgi:hypothetical protein
MIERIVASPLGSPDFTGELFVLGGILLTALLGWIGTFIVKRLREPTRIESLWDRVDVLTKEIYGDEETKTLGLKRRLETAERRDATKGRVIRALTRQWPTGTVPYLNPDDILDLEEDTIPAHWKVKP